MIYKNNNIQLVVNNEDIELSDKFSISINNELFQPDKLTINQAEYSYSITIPATPNNNRVLLFANDIQIANQFNQLFPAELYVDEHLIFQGQLMINSYKDNEYQCNLVSPKVYNLDDIFGDAVLSDIPWYVPFSGVTSINEYNASGASNVSFPLVSYGVFQKVPSYSDEVANDYTSKFQIDKYNRWWIESFYPSLNMLETIKKAFEWKGYNVNGTAFDDINLKEIFLSTNLSSDQYPIYNLANPYLGEIEITASTNINGEGYEKELEFPYFHVNNPRAGFNSAEGSQTGTRKSEEWNWKSVRVYDLLGSGSTITSGHKSYIYDPGECVVVIPADGFYKIDLEARIDLNTGVTSFTAAQNVITDGGSGNDIEEKDIENLHIGLEEMTPVEIQLIKVNDVGYDDIELIKGKWNKQYRNGNPTVSAYTISNRNYNNINEWLTCYPHEDPYHSDLPTKKGDTFQLKNTDTPFRGNITGTSSVNGVGGSRSGEGNGFGTGRRYGGNSTTPRKYEKTMFGYVPNMKDTMAYDPAVNENFICGFSTLGGGQPSVIKNGYSWTSRAYENEAFYNQPGYNKVFQRSNDSTAAEQSATTFNKNEYYNAPDTEITIGKRQLYPSTSTTTYFNGKLSCCVYLKRSDILSLVEVHRAYDTVNGQQFNYQTSTTVKLKLTAMSPHNKAYLDNEHFGYDSPSEFDEDLRLSNFLNNETPVSQFIENVIKSFNFRLYQEGNNIWIDKNISPINNDYPAVIDIDNRTNTYDVDSIKINYPTSLAVKYSINQDEWGYEASVPSIHINDDDWKDYADSGYSEIIIDNNPYNVNKLDISSNFSYTWYDDFKWIEVDKDDVEDPATYEYLNIPVISNYQDMIDGYDYEEAMQHDGYSLTQRLWLRPKKKPYTFIWTDSFPAEKVDLYLPENENNDIVLNYKDENNSLLMKYFNSKQNLAANAVTVEAYITTDEYLQIKAGARIKFDETLWQPTNIVFDATNNSPAQITMIKL